LLLPAVQSAREAGRRNTCMNNVSQLGKAVFLHDNDAKGIPGWRNLIVGDNQTYVVNWAPKLLPYLERLDLFRLYENGGFTDAIADLTQIALFICPTSPAETPKTPKLCYAGNGGTGQVRTSTDQTLFTGNGVMFDATGDFAKKVTLDAVSAGDGTTTTLLFAEKCGAAQNPDLRWSNSAAWDIPRSAAGAIRSAFLNEGASGGGVGPGPASPLKTPTSYTGSNGADASWYPSANHSGGVVAAFCDGHTKFIADRISLETYKQLMTSDGPHSVFWNTAENRDELRVLNEGDY
jgi:prepilin-type processing-associated H-X9-DG protein